MRGALFLLGAVFGVLVGSLTVWDALEAPPVALPEPPPTVEARS